MINVVELIVSNEFTDVSQLKTAYLHGIKEYLSDYGYMATHVDKSEWYSYEQKLLVDTNAPGAVLSTAVEKQNKKQKDAYGVLVS
jgi:hypothetical protein